MKVNAINLLKEVRVDLPITIRHKQSVDEWVSKVGRVSNEDNSDVLLCSGNYGDAEFVSSTSFDSDSSFYRNFFNYVDTQSSRRLCKPTFSLILK